jgi:hypothetical protein
MNLSSFDNWILKEFGHKRKKSQVRIGNAYQAKIPDLLTKKISVNAAKRYDFTLKEVFFNYQIELKSISIHLKKLTGSDIESIKRNIKSQNCEQFAARKSELKYQESAKKIFEK